MAFTNSELAVITRTLSTMYDNAAKMEEALTLPTADDMIHAFSYNLGIVIREDSTVGIVSPHLATKVRPGMKRAYANGAHETAKVMRRRLAMERALKGTQDGIAHTLKVLKENA